MSSHYLYPPVCTQNESFVCYFAVQQLKINHMRCALFFMLPAVRLEPPVVVVRGTCLDVLSLACYLARFFVLRFRHGGKARVQC